MFKKLFNIFTLIAILILSTNVSSVYASTNNNGFVVENDNEVLIFDNHNDYNSYLQNNRYRYSSSYTKVISTTRKNRQYIGTSNMTPSWSKTREYTVHNNTNYTATGNVSYNNLTGSLSISYKSGVSYPITASSSRYSKLGMWADLKIEELETTYIDYNSQKVSVIKHLRINKLETYLGVVYK